MLCLQPYQHFFDSNEFPLGFSCHLKYLNYAILYVLHEYKKDQVITFKMA